MSETRKLTTILAADVAGYSRLAAEDEDRTLARLRALRGDVIDPAIAAHHGRVVKRTGDGILIEFRSVTDAVRCAIEVQNALVERNSLVPAERRIEFRVGIHVGDVIEESDGDLMGDGVNIAARLENICAPGAICLSEQAYWQVKSRLDLAVSDLGDRDLKNIPEPVHVYSLEVGKPAQARPAVTVAPVLTPPPKKRTVLVPLLTGIAVLIFIAAVAGWYFLVRPGAKLAANAPAHLSIVVLPFANLSNDPKQDYFSDGITDNLTTDLSRIRNSFVIARNTAFTYKGKSVDAKEIGKELGVRYVLEGSVQRDGNRVRVNAQLIDAGSGSHLWADRFEDEMADLFKLQDEIVGRLANLLNIELINAESEHAGPRNPDAIDLAMRGWALNWRPRTKDLVLEARTFFERALEIDPNDDSALSGLAYTYHLDFFYGWGNSSTNYVAKLIGPADHAIAINRHNAMAYYSKSFYLSHTHRESEALTVAEAGLDNNQSSAILYMARAIAEIPLGRYERARSDLKQSMRLNPVDFHLGPANDLLANVELQLGHDAAALEESHKAIEEGYRVWAAYAWLAAAEALSGQLDAARSALDEARRLNPHLNVKWAMMHAIMTPRLLEGLRKAGLPEQEDGPRLSIVVLPFTNLSGDAKQDYLADVLTDELTTYISRIPGSFVIARNTAFTYKGKPTDVKTIGKELGVRYALEGSVQPTDKRIRTNAQLIDTETGAHLWAESFDNDKTDLLQTEDEVVTRVARSLDIALTEVEVAKGARVRPDNPDAQDLAMRCLANFNANVFVYDPRKLASLDEPCERAVKLDPKNVTALRLLANRHAQMVYRGVSVNPEEDLHRAEDLIQTAFALEPNNAGVHSSKIAVLYAEGRMEEAVNEARKAIELNPSNMYAYYALCASEDGAGHPEAAITCADRAIRLSPNDPLLYLLFDYHGLASSLLGKYDDAIVWYRKALALEPSDIQTLIALSRLFAHQGKLEEAHEMYVRALSVPGMKLKTIRQYRAFLTRIYPSNAPAILAYRKSAEEDMRKAGMPEQ